jgi:hypothetical protein
MSDLLGYNRIRSKDILYFPILVSWHIQERPPYEKISWDKSGYGRIYSWGELPDGGEARYHAHPHGSSGTLPNFAIEVRKFNVRLC